MVQCGRGPEGGAHFGKVARPHAQALEWPCFPWFEAEVGEMRENGPRGSRRPCLYKETNAQNIHPEIRIHERLRSEEKFRPHGLMGWRPDRDLLAGASSDKPRMLRPLATLEH